MKSVTFTCIWAPDTKEKNTYMVNCGKLAYKDAGIITHIGAAFSRDQPEKIYIQDRIRENLDDLKTAMINKEGSFYLCGPTWPVPDITQALQDIISADAEERGIKVDLDAAIEDLKDTSRYILEVY